MTDETGGDTQHEHEWVKEGPAAVRGSSGTELWIIYTCETDECPAWKRNSLYGEDEAEVPEKTPLDKFLRRLHR